MRECDLINWLIKKNSLTIKSNRSYAHKCNILATTHHRNSINSVTYGRAERSLCPTQWSATGVLPSSHRLWRTTIANQTNSTWTKNATHVVTINFTAGSDVDIAHSKSSSEDKRISILVLPPKCTPAAWVAKTCIRSPE